MAAEIRPYRDADKTALVSCLEGLQQYICSIDELKRTLRAEDFDGEGYVERLLEKIQGQQGGIFVAESDDKIVGCIAGVIPEPTADDAFEGYPTKDGKILELYVEKGHRGQMIGHNLMWTMEKYFKEKGCTGCHVDCFAPNTHAHGFYHLLGYTDRLISLLKIL